MRPRNVSVLLLPLAILGCDDPAPPESGEQPTSEEARAEDEPVAPPERAAPSVWNLRSEDAIREEIQSALARARTNQTRVLLEFGADWCPDCNEVARLGELSPAKDVLEEKYELVRIHVGRFDRHEELLRHYRVERIATLVVLEADGSRVAQTTLEPIGQRTGLDAAGLAAWLSAPVDQWRRPDMRDDAPAPADTPLFPAEIVEG